MRCAQAPVVVLVLAFVLARVFAAPIPASAATAPATAVAAAQGGTVRTDARQRELPRHHRAAGRVARPRIAEAARTAAVRRDSGSTSPSTITVNVDCRRGNSVRLFTDGQDTYTLSIRSGFDLLPPGVCGIYNLYGMCHELGHVVMYRVIRDHGWMTGRRRRGVGALLRVARRR